MGLSDGRLTHVDESGAARMVDVSAKQAVRRVARAEGFISLGPDTLRLVRENGVQKGDVLGIARVGGIMGAKRTADLIPLCHNIEIESANVDLELTEAGISIRSEVVCTDKTGIEMEALTAVSVAALTIYDMCKAVDKSMVIGPVRLLSKEKQVLG